MNYMDDLQLAVQLCLPLEWTGPWGGTMNEFQLRELLAYAKFMDEAPTCEYNWKDLKEDECILMDDFGGKYVVKKEEPSLDDVLLKDDLDV